MLLPNMVCNALVARCWLLGADQQAMRPGHVACCPARDHRLRSAAPKRGLCGECWNCAVKLTLKPNAVLS